MVPILRLSLSTGAVLGAVLFGVLHGPSTWMAELCLDPGDLPGNLSRLQEEELRSEDLNRRIELVLGNLRWKQDLAQALVEKRCTLAVAAAQVRRLLDRQPDGWAELRKAEQGDTDEELVCRHLIGWAQKQVEEDPRREREVTHDLEAAMFVHLQTGEGGEDPPTPSP